MELVRIIFFSGILILFITSLGCTDNKEGEIEDSAQDMGKDNEEVEIIENEMEEKIDPVLDISFDKYITTSVGNQNTQMKLISREADCENIKIKLSSTEGIKLSDNLLEIIHLEKDEEKDIEISYEMFKPGNDEIYFSIEGDKIDSFTGKINISSLVGAPIYQIGEFWVYNQTYNDISYLLTHQVTREEDVDGIPAYVVKEISGNDIKGSYKLIYLAKEDISIIKSEIYNEDKLDSTSEYVPSLSDLPFPLKVNNKVQYSGTVTGLGKIDIDGTILSYENRECPAGEYETFKIKYILALPLGTTNFIGYYSPEEETYIYQNSKTIIGDKTIADIEMELVKHGMSPEKPPEIQVEIKIPQGFVLYRNDDLGFIIAHPANWDVSVETGNSDNIYYVDFSSKTQTFLVSVDYTGYESLEEYNKLWQSAIRSKPMQSASAPKEISIFDRKGYEWDYGTSEWNGRMYLFEKNGVGYLLTGSAGRLDYDSFIPVLEQASGTFFILGSNSHYKNE